MPIQPACAYAISRPVGILDRLTCIMEGNRVSEFAINDRVANYGDGLFTTMAVRQGRIALFSRHVKRLCDNAERLAIPIDRTTLITQLRQAALRCDTGTLKLLISAGVGGRGYARTQDSGAGFHFSFHQPPSQYADWRQNGISIGVSEIRLGHQPVLAGLKHTNRLEQVLIKNTMPSNVDDVVVCDTEQCIVEASAANLFWRVGKTWYTADLALSGVAGVMREFVLEQLAAQGLRCEVGRYHIAGLTNANAMCVTNALMQVVPVHTWWYSSQRYPFNIAPVQQLADVCQSAYQSEYDDN